MMSKHNRTSIYASGWMLIFLFMFPGLGFAQSDGAVKQHLNPATDYQLKKEQANKDTVGVVTGSITGTYVRIGADLADVLNRKDLRVLTILGRGSLQNINDILYLKGVDIGIVQGDVLEYLERTRKQSRIKQRIHYITKLYNEEVHILASRNIRSFQDLAGRRVNFGKSGSGTYLTSSTIFRKLGVRVKVETFDQRKALEKLKRNEISAMVYVVGKPASFLKSIPADSNLQILPIPYTGAIRDTYLPSSFTADDYPNLIARERNVSTVATSAVMAVYNWPEKSARYKKVERFIRYFFDNVREFRTPSRHPKWKELNLAAVVPGWTRFKAADAIMKDQSGKRNVNVSDLKRQFQAFLNSQNLSSNDLSKEQQEKLFRSFLEWSRN